MLQAEPIQLDFLTQPSLAEFLFWLLLSWFTALAFIVIGLYALHRNRNSWARPTAFLLLGLGAGFCFLLGLSFTPINHHRYAWNSSSRNINDLLNWVAVLAIWGLSFLSFWVAQKIAKRPTK